MKHDSKGQRSNNRLGRGLIAGRSEKFGGDHTSKQGTKGEQGQARESERKGRGSPKKGVGAVRKWDVCASVCVSSLWKQCMFFCLIRG